jgi:hypothetical protein
MTEVTNQEVEKFLCDSKLKYRQHPARQDIWELSFTMRTSPFTIFIDNGVGNPHLLSVNLLYMKPQTNHREFYRQLLRKTGTILFSKFTLDDAGNVFIRGAIPRDASFSPLEKLRHIMGAVLQAADQWYLELLREAMPASP